MHKTKILFLFSILFVRCNGVMDEEDCMISLTNVLTRFESSESFNVASDCALGENQYTTYSSDEFWCGNYSKEFTGHWSVEFPGYQYVSGFAIKTTQEKYLQKLIVAYGSGYNGVRYILNDDSSLKEFDTSAGDVTIKLDKMITTQKITFTPYGETTEEFAIQFEVFGCPWYAIVSPIGLETGMLSGDSTKESTSYNQNGIGLNSAFFGGWLGSIEDDYQSTDSKTIYIQVDLEDKMKVIMIDIQQVFTETSTNRYFVAYGETSNQINQLTDVFHLDASSGETKSHVFEPYLLLKYFRLYPENEDSLMYPRIQIELYTHPLMAADHAWSFIEGDIKDTMSFNDFINSSDVSFKADGVEINKEMYHPLKTYPYSEGCLANPSQCHDGLSLSFNAKVSKVPKGIEEIHDITATSQIISGSCDTSSELNFKNKFALFVASVKLPTDANVTEAVSISTLNLPADFNATKVMANTFIEKDENFVTSCAYHTNENGSTSAGIVTITPWKGDEYRLVGLQKLINVALGSAIFMYGKSLTVVFRPMDDIDLPIEDLKTLDLFTYPGCDLVYDALSALSDSAFTTESPPGCASVTDANHVKFTLSTWWESCNDAFVEIDLGYLRMITMLKVQSELLNWVHEFVVKYKESSTSNEWLEIQDQDSNEFVFRTESSDVQYIPLPKKIYAQYLRVYPRTSVSSSFKFHLDIVECKQGTGKYITWLSNQRREVQISPDGKSYYTVYYHAHTDIYQYLVEGTTHNKVLNDNYMKLTDYFTNSNGDIFGLFENERLWSFTNKRTISARDCSAYQFSDDGAFLYCLSGGAIYRMNWPGESTPCDSNAGEITTTGLDSCYYIYNGRTDATSTVNCPSGMSLTSITSSSERHFLQVTVAEVKNNKKYLIGLDIESEPYTWQDDEIYQYYYWKQGQPNDGNKAKCVVIYHHSWYDYDSNGCSDLNGGYICKRPIYDNTADELLIPGDMKQFFITPDNTIYGLGTEDSRIYKFETTEWVLFSDIICSSFKISADGDIWCVHSGDSASPRLLRWNAVILSWELIVEPFDCISYDIGHEEILCVNQEYKVERISRNRLEKDCLLERSRYGHGGSEIVVEGVTSSYDCIVQCQLKRIEYPLVNAVELEPDGKCLCNIGTNLATGTANRFCLIKDVENDEFLYPLISTGLQKFADVYQGNGFLVSMRDDYTLKFFFNNEGDTAMLQYDVDIDISKNYLLVWSASDGTLNLYVDSILVDSTILTSGDSVYFPSSGYANIGGFFNMLSTYNQEFQIGDIKIWKHPMTPSILSSVFDVGRLQVASSKECNSFLLFQNNWYCLEKDTGNIYMHPSLSHIGERKWSYHSTVYFAVLTELTELNGEYLIGLSKYGNSYIYFNNEWMSFLSLHLVRDLSIVNDEILMTRNADSHPAYVYNLQDCLQSLQANDYCSGHTFDSYHKSLHFMENGDFYIQKLTHKIVVIPSGSSAEIQLASFYCHRDFVVYHGVMYCMQTIDKVDYVYQLIDGQMQIVDSQCKNILPWDNGYVCNENPVFTTQVKAKGRISFSEGRYTTSMSNSGITIQSSSYYYPRMTGPPADEDISKKVDFTSKFFFADQSKLGKIYTTDPEDINVHNECIKSGGKLANIESVTDKNALDMFLLTLPHDYQYYVGYDYRIQGGCSVVKVDSAVPSHCDSVNGFICEADRSSLSKTVLDFISISRINNGDCVTTNYQPNENNKIAYLGYDDTKFTILTFDVSNFNPSSAILHAHIMIKPTVDINKNLNIGVLQQNSSDNCSDFSDVDNIVHMLSHVTRIEWGVVAVTSQEVISPDISKMIDFFFYQRRYFMEEVDNLKVVIFWNDQQNKRLLKVSSLQLFVIHEIRRDNNFLLFPTAPNTPYYTPAKFEVDVPSYALSFMFSYFMYGEDVGTLYVWLIDINDIEAPIPLFYIHGNQGNEWKQSPVFSTGNDTAKWKVRFLSYRTDGLYGDIAIDNIYFMEYNYGFFDPAQGLQYSLSDDREYVNRTLEVNATQPILVIPFKYSFKATSPFAEDLEVQDGSSATLSVSDYQWSDDKYGFPKHALQVTGTIQLDDFSVISAKITGSFTVMFHIKFTMASDATFCEIGNSFAIQFKENSLVLKGSEEIYVSEIKFVDDTWTYVGIVCKDGDIYVYFNNTLDLVETENTQIDSVSGDLKFFTENNFDVLVSCFQLYNEALTRLQIQAFEFCPDRLDLSSCPVHCHDGGICSPLKADCVCPFNVERFYDSVNCENVYLTKFMSDSSLYLSFDDPDIITLRGELDAVDFTNSFLAQSPINYARCTQDVGSVLGSINYTCFAQGCAGYYLSFWIFVDEIENTGVTEFFKFSDISMSANFTFNETNPGLVSGLLSYSHCNKTFTLPFKAWFFVIMEVTSESLTMYIGSNEILTISTNDVECETIDHVDEASLFIGAVSEVCIDEFAYEINQFDGDYLSKRQDYYREITYGTYDYESLDDRLKYSVNNFPIIELIVNSSDITGKALDKESYDYQVVENKFHEVVVKRLSDVINFEDVKSMNFTDILLSDTNTTAYVNVHINSSISAGFCTTFDDYPVTTFKHADYEIRCNIPSRHDGIYSPFMKPEIVLTYTNSSFVSFNVTNNEFLDTRYHTGYLLVYKKSYVNHEQIDFVTKFYHHGSNIILLEEGIEDFKEYEFQIMSVHNGGFSIPYIETLITYARVNVAPPVITNQYDVVGGLAISWNYYHYHNWLSFNLISYRIYYKVYEGNITTFNASNPSIDFNFVDVNTTNLSYELKNLEAYTEYEVLLGTVNDIGLGSVTDTIIQRTGPGVPELAPEIVLIHTLSVLEDETFISALNLQWTLLPDDVEIYNAPSLSGYTIKLTPLYSDIMYEGCKTVIEHSEDDAMVTAYNTFVSCNPMKPMKLEIAAKTFVGDGVFNEYCFVVNRTVPGKINVFNVTLGPILGNGGTSVLITIGNVSLQDESTVITHYLVTFSSSETEEVNGNITINIDHTEEDLLHWEKLQGSSQNCSDFPYPRPSSTLIYDYLLPVAYFTNYTFDGYACGDEGCSTLFLNSSMRTAEHIPICPPHNLNMFNTSSTSLGLTFDPITHYCLSGVLKEYIVVFMDTNDLLDVLEQGITYEEIRNFAYNDSINGGILEDKIQEVFYENQLEFYMTGLHEYWNYSAIIFAVNGQGVGGFGVVSAFTAEDVPSGPPQNCMVENHNSSTLKLHFQQPDIFDLNGIVHYEIELLNEYNEASNYSITKNGEEEAVILLYLSRFTYYNITVYPITVKGMGPPCEMYTQTLEYVPTSPPNNFTVQDISNDTVLLSWREIPLRERHGVILNYKVVAYGYLRNDSVACETRYVTNLDGAFNLFPGTGYTFEISGCTNEGCGAVHTVYTRSQEMEPSGVVFYIEQANVTYDSMIIMWEDVLPMMQRGNITHYNVTVQNLLHTWQEDDELWEQTTSVFSKDLFIEGLDNYTDYNIIIVAFTAIGAGPTTEFVFRTSENVPSAAPLNVTGISTSSSGMNVSWLPLDEMNYEGILLGCYIRYEVVEGYTDIRGGAVNGTFNCSGADNTSCVIEGLSLGTPYEVDVSCYTSIGHGPWSVSANISTGDFVDGNWTSWSEWGSCSKSCGTGESLQYRSCSLPYPEAGGSDCFGNNTKRRICNDFECPGFYLGLPGESCDQTCEHINSNRSGNQKEPFLCAPSYGSDDTTGAFLQLIDPMNYKSVFTIHCFSSADLSVYNRTYDPSYNAATGECLGYTEMKITDCKSAAPDNVRRLCRCLDDESTQYTDWSNWGECSKPCGMGRYDRYRECIREDGECSGSNMDSQDCNIPECPVNGEWGQWSEFLNCSKSVCGFGSIVRTRQCDSPAEKYGGDPCPGVDTHERRGCNVEVCPVHGSWGPWLDVGECKHSCGNESYRYQYRYCNNPSPKYGGEECEGENMLSYPCSDNKPCQNALYSLSVRFPNAHWEFPMYRLDYHLSQNFTTYVIDLIEKFYIKSEMANHTQDIVITMDHLSKGSVIAHFTIQFGAVPSSEALVLQHELESGAFEGEDVELMEIHPDILPFSPPVNVMAKSYTYYTINVTWDRNATGLQGEFYLYQVFFKKLNGTAEETKWDNDATRNTSYTITDLIPGEWYGVRVVTANEQGNGVASPLIEIQVKEGPPYIAPPNAEKQILDMTTVFFSWEKIPPIQVPGTLLGYEIKYRIYFDENDVENWHGDFTRYTAEARETQRTIEGLKAFTWYWVELAGYTRAGAGPTVRPFVFRTPPGPPSISPPNATVHDRFSTTELLVKWDSIPHEFRNGYLTGYRLFYRKVQQGGVDTNDREILGDYFLDEFTHSVKLNRSLESYTRYEIFLYGYSPYGDGPQIVLYGDTCKCPPEIFSNWLVEEPYTYVHHDKLTGTQAYGLFPDLLNLVIDAVCTDCLAPKPNIYYNQTRRGHPSLKSNAIEVKTYLDDSVDISFPVLGNFDIPKYAGTYPFIGIVPSQGSAMIIYQPRVKTIGMMIILGAVYNAWPVILIAVLLAALSGWFLWIFEQPVFQVDKVEPEEGDISFNKGVYGAYEGFWLSFISMTTLGYGDYAPFSNPAKAFMVLWVLTGLVIVSIFGGAVSSGMSVGSMDKEYKLYGTNVAAVKESFEEMVAIRRNAIVINSTMNNMTSISDVIKEVASGNAEIGLVDATSMQSFMEEAENASLSVYKILDLQSGFGVVLSGEFARVATDFRSFVTAKESTISKFVEEKVGTLTPNLIEIEELLLSPEESESLLLTLFIMYIIMAIVGIIAWLLLSRCKNRKVHAQDEIHEDVASIHDALQELTTNLDDIVEELTSKHKQERVDLYFLQTHYKEKHAKYVI